MTRLLTIPTEHENMAAAVEALAPTVGETSVRIESHDRVVAGSWVRFRFLLRDGTLMWEGVGRAASCVPAAGDRYAVVIDSLSFDAKNEVFFERIRLEAERQTGKTPRVATGEPSAPEAPRPKYSSVPPAPRRALPPAPPPAKLSSVVKSALRPKPGGPPPLRPPPGKPSTITAPGELAERARTLSRRLNLAAPSLARGRWTEQRVLEAALRMGIEALEGLIAARDAGE